MSQNNTDMIDIHYKTICRVLAWIQLGCAELLSTSKIIASHPLLHLLLLFCNIYIYTHTTTKSADISLSFKLNEFVSFDQSE